MNHFEASVGETKTPVEGFAVSSLDGIWSDRSFLPWTWILCFSMYALISWPFSVSCFSNVSINFASWKKSAQVKMVIYHLFVMIRFYVHTYMHIYCQFGQMETFVNLSIACLLTRPFPTDSDSVFFLSSVLKATTHF